MQRAPGAPMPAPQHSPPPHTFRPPPPAPLPRMQSSRTAPTVSAGTRNMMTLSSFPHNQRGKVSKHKVKDLAKAEEEGWWRRRAAASTPLPRTMSAPNKPLPPVPPPRPVHLGGGAQAATTEQHVRERLQLASFLFQCMPPCWAEPVRLCGMLRLFCVCPHCTGSGAGAAGRRGRRVR